MSTVGSDGESDESEDAKSATQMIAHVPSEHSVSSGAHTGSNMMVRVAVDVVWALLLTAKVMVWVPGIDGSMLHPYRPTWGEGGAIVSGTCVELAQT